MNRPKKHPPRSKREPINKRPGRTVCICTAKGKIIYLEDRFTHTRNNQRR